MPEPVQPNPGPRHPPPVVRPRPAEGQRRTADTAGADPGLKAACEDVEALFIHHLLSEMRKTVAKSGLIDGGRSEEIYTSLMDAELAKEMARSGGLGLSVILQEQLSGPGGSLRGSAGKR
jgi:Rod binding domain-containing protein